MNQVSSRGCSRAYILCVLFRGLQYVHNLRSQSQPVSFPFPAFEIECWLEKAKEDCSDVEFQRMYGGTDFSPSDASTFWTSASHFYTWWKNNIERKTKFLSLLKDSIYDGDDEKNITRSRYCKQAIALAINIKNHFERVLNQQVDRNMLVHIELPFPMPVHLTAMQVNVARCTVCSSELSGKLDAQESCADVGRYVTCAYCVSPITYDEYSLSVLDSAQSKLASKKRSSTARNSSKKRCRTDDDVFVASREKRGRFHHLHDVEARTAMDCMHQAVGLQHARRALRSSKEAALDDLSAAFDFDEAGSALLLELKENSKVVVSDPHGLDSSTGGVELSALQVELRETTHMTQQQQASVCEPLRIVTSPFPYEKSSTPELASGPNTRDFLLACYRDGIYPSPVVPSAAAPWSGSGVCGHTFLATCPSSYGERMVSYSAGTEVDAGADAAGELGADHALSSSCRPAGEPFAVVNDAGLEIKSDMLNERLVGNCTSPSAAALQPSQVVDATVPVTSTADTGRAEEICGEPTKLLATPLSQTPTQQQQVQQQSPLPSFGYDELQQLLTHLLYEARD